MGDGECTEGSVWEAAMFASKQSLHNLIAIVDRNGIGSIDFTENYASLEPFADKWKAFGWEVYICNGHDFGELDKIFRSVRDAISQKPKIILAETVKGKGISFIENDPIWHTRSISGDDEIQLAKQELIWCEDGL
jgi:transketolase